MIGGLATVVAVPVFVDGRALRGIYNIYTHVHPHHHPGSESQHMAHTARARGRRRLREREPERERETVTVTDRSPATAAVATAKTTPHQESTSSVSRAEKVGGPLRPSVLHPVTLRHCSRSARSIGLRVLEDTVVSGVSMNLTPASLCE